MLKIKRMISDERNRNFFKQLIFTYGIVLLASACLILLKDCSIFDAFKIMIDSLLPTTITFSGLILVQESQKVQNSLFLYVLEILIVGLALIFITFNSRFLYYENAQPPDKIVLGIGVCGIIMSVFCLVITKRTFYLSKIIQQSALNDSSDGNISG